MPTVPRWLLIALAVVLLVGLMAQIVLEAVVDGDWLAGRLRSAVGEQRATVSVGRGDPGLLGRSLAIEDLAIEPVAGGDADAFPMSIRVPRLRLDGIDLWTLIAHGGLQVDRITVEQPEVSRHRRAGENSTATAATPDTTAVLRSLRELPPLGAGHIALQGGRLDLDPATLVGITIDLLDVEVSAAAARARDRLFFCREINVDVAASHWQRAATRYEVGPLRFSSRDSLLELEEFAIRPLDPGGAPVPLLALDGQGTQLWLRGLRLAELRWPGTVAAPAVVVGQASIDTLVLHAFSDKTQQPPLPPPPPRMPHQALRRLAWSVSTDTLRLAHGTIHYSERPRGGGEAGHFRFEQVDATVVNLSNDPSRMGPDQPALITVNAIVADSTFLHVRLHQDVLSGPVSARVEGSLTDLPAAGFNSILTPLEGIRFTGGWLDQLQFDYTLDDRRAMGLAHGLFSDLQVEMVGEDRTAGPIEELKSLIGNLLVLRSQSEPTGIDSLMTVPIEYNRLEQDTYLKFLWAGLRSGLKNLIGL